MTVCCVHRDRDDEMADAAPHQDFHSNEDIGQQ